MTESSPPRSAAYKQLEAFKNLNVMTNKVNANNASAVASSKTMANTYQDDMSAASPSKTGEGGMSRVTNRLIKLTNM